MKYSVNFPDSDAEALRDAAARADLSQAEYSRRALLASLNPPAPDPDLTDAINNLVRTQEELSRTREEKDKLACDLAEIERFREDLITCNEMLKEREGQVKTLEMQMGLCQDQVRTLEERSRAAELKAAMSEKDREISEAKLRGIEAVQAQMEERLRESRAVNSQNEGLIASLMTAQNRILTEAGRPWWRFWKA